MIFFIKFNNQFLFKLKGFKEENMNFSESVSSCMSKYATFSGRASRAEFWWFYLFTIMLQGGATIIGGKDANILPTIASLVTILPGLAVSCRRLHDINKSGWWFLISFTVIGIIPLVIWWAKETKNENNRFGILPNEDLLNKTKNIKVKNIKSPETINSILQKERLKYRVRTYYLLGFVGFASIFVYFFILMSNGTKIIILPEEANVNAKIKSKNFLDLSFNNFIYSFSSKPEFSVSSKGYKSINEVIPSENKGKFFEVLMSELPGILNVSINNKNENTQWFLNNKFIFRGEKLETSLPAGEYILTVNNPFFEKKNLNVTIKKGESKNLDISLDSIKGFIKLQSKPDKALVFVNNKQIGVTPTIFKDEGGEYNVEIKKENYETINDKIVITNQNKVNQRNYFLELIEAKIKISVKPKDGNLNINGVSYQTDKFINLKSNKDYTLSYEKPGFKTQIINFKLIPNEKRIENINLEDEYGIVEIISQPEGEIWINGKFSGQTPKEIKLRTVEQNIEIKKKNFRSVVNKILPKANKRKILNINLIDEKVAKLQEAKTTYNNSIDIEMKLYNPKGDVMQLGSERFEKGQRANEILRKVKLTKPFYVSLYEISNENFSNFKNRQTSGNDNFPVNNISWIEAAAFCNWLSKEEGLEEFYIIKNEKLVDFNSDSEGYRLLSEAEWEWLSRKANKKKTSKFSWGDGFIIPDNYLNIADESARLTQKNFIKDYNDSYENIAEIGSFQQEISGLYDLSGNLSEWIHDYYTITFSRKIETDPLGSKKGSSHVIKGANWTSGTLTKIRPSYRENGIKGNETIGFRIARYL